METSNAGNNTNWGAGVLAKTSNKGKISSYTAGVADLSTKKPVKSDYRFRIGSVTKTFTATTVLQLVGENRVQLDDSIEKWLPSHSRKWV